MSTAEKKGGASEGDVLILNDAPSSLEGGDAAVTPVTQ